MGSQARAPALHDYPNYSITRLLNYQISLRFSDPIHERLQLARARWMPQFAQRLGFYLSNAFTGDGEGLAHFFQSVLGAVFKAEAHLDDFFFTRGERAQHLRGLVLEVDVDDGLGGRDHGAVLNEVAQVRIFFFADGRLQRDGLLRDLEHLAHLGHRDVHTLGDLF